MANFVSRPLVRRGGVALIAAAMIAAAAGPVSAGGMVLHTRGVRPTARGGAFVAGADDLGALWFNVAGLAHLADAKTRDAFLLDAAFVSQKVTYTRIDSGMNPQQPVTNQAPGLPVPSVAYAHKVSKRLVVGGGVWAPYAGLTKFPEDGPQRYSSIDLSKSLILTVAVGAGYKLTDKIRVGATVENLAFLLNSTVVLSGCPGQTLCAPEDPDFDAVTQVSQNSLFVPTGSAGVQIDLSREVTAGLSFHLPAYIRGKGKVATRLPPSGFYNGASVEGDRADVKLTLPASIRAGVEVHPGRWHIEAALDVELWSQHKNMSITPVGVRIVNAAGVGTYVLSPITIPRHYKNSYAASLGIEGQPIGHLPLHVMAGYTYETAAAPDEYLSVLTVDGTKNVAAIGAGYQFGKYRIDAMLSYFLMADRTVTPDVGISPQLTPIRDNADPADQLPVYVNWGTYESSWLAAGLGLSTKF